MFINRRTRLRALQKVLVPDVLVIDVPVLPLNEKGEIELRNDIQFGHKFVPMSELSPKEQESVRRCLP